MDDADIQVLQFDTGQKKTLLHGGYWPRYMATSRNTGHLLYVHDGTLYGVGFDPGSIPEREEPGRAGLGIFGMRERATLLRGTLEIHSAPLKGTEVVANLPLEDNHVG